MPDVLGIFWLQVQSHSVAHALEQIRPAAELVLQRFAFARSPDFWRHPDWRKVRAEVLLAYGRRCLKCGERKDIQVDHIKPRYMYPWLALSRANLQPLCRPCNLAKGALNSVDYRHRKKFKPTAEDDYFGRLMSAYHLALQWQASNRGRLAAAERLTGAIHRKARAAERPDPDPVGAEIASCERALAGPERISGRTSTILSYDKDEIARKLSSLRDFARRYPRLVA